MNTHPNITSSARRQSGVALIVGLIILLLLTLITVTAIRMTTMEQRMASNMRNQSVAFQSAESALREAEAFIAGTDTAFNPLRLTDGPFQNVSETPCVNGLCGATDPLQSASIYTATGLRTAATGITNIATEPQWMIELERIDPSADSSRLYATFRITARAVGIDANSVVQLQTTFRLHVQSFIF